MKNVFLSMLMFVSMTASAQNVPDKPAAEGKPSAEMASIRMANNLIRYGYSKQEALPLIDALQILSEVQTQESTDKKEGQETKMPGDKKISFDIPEVLEAAKEYANGDQSLMAIISDLETDLQQHRGAVGGPKRHVDFVNGNSYDTYSCNFVAGRLAEVGLSGDGDTDLDLYIYDSNGNLIAQDADYSDDCYVRWVPKWTGRYTIKVVNRGPLYNKYIILTN